MNGLLFIAWCVGKVLGGIAGVVQRKTERFKVKTKVLFLIKRQLGYNGCTVPSKGLFNSAQFVVNALQRSGIDALIVEVVDANDIDREVTRCRPTHCIVEAIWATPLKMDELRRLHPKVEFIVRIHSNIPFLASEGMAIEWLRSYTVRVACNSQKAVQALSPFLCHPPLYLPNIYEPGVPAHQRHLDRAGPNIWIGCLGAIRPLKNQLLQAVAAIEYANMTGRRLYYHINTRVEQGGEAVLRNIRALFGSGPHLLIEHGWCETHARVMEIVSSLDLSLQLSFSETFNLVSADAVWCGVPIVVSPEISWAPGRVKVGTNSVPYILEAMRREETKGRTAALRNLKALIKHNEHALDEWKEFLGRKRKHTK